MESNFPELLISNFYAGYDKRNVLNGINLEVGKGEIVAVVGQNGAGKSTLIRSIIGLVPFIRGTIVYQDKDISHYDIKRRVDSGLFYFMQGGQVFPSLTVGENLVLAMHSLSKEIQDQRISDLMPVVFPEKFNSTKGSKSGHFTLLSQNASRLSGGEKHKLALMMVLLNFPQVLLLDEPSAGLSPKNAGRIYDVISTYVSRYQLTVLLIEQNVKLAVENSNRIYLLKGGRIIKNVMTEKLKSLDGKANPKKLERFFFST